MIDFASLISGVLGLGFLASEVALKRGRQSATVAGSQEADKGSLRLLWRVTLLAMVVGSLLSVFRVGPTLPGDESWWLGAGSLTFVFGTMVRWWAIHHLGRFFTVDVAISVTHRVIDSGPYRWVRHPSYTGLMMQFLGLALCLNNPLSLLIIMVPITSVLIHRIMVEEAALTSALGNSYVAYAKSHKRLVPGMY